jgi:hypothetical protein
MYACTTTKQNQSVTTVAVVFLCCQTERTDEREKERKEKFDRQKQTSHIRRRFYIVFSYYSKDTNIE